MAAAVVPATFKDGGEAGQIGIDIGERIDERMPNTGLRGEVNDVRKTMFLEQACHPVAIGEIESDETQARRFGELRAARLLQRGIIIGVHVVESDHVAALAQQSSRNMKADKPGGACHENGAVSHRSPSPVVFDCLEPPQVDPLGLFRAIELCLHIQNNAPTILQQLANQRPPAGDISLCATARMTASAGRNESIDVSLTPYSW